MKIPIRHSFIGLILLVEAYLLIKGEECWIPMVCDDQLTWSELTCTKEEEKALEVLTERLDGMKSELNQLKKVMETSETNSVPPSVVGVEETTTPSVVGVKETTTPWGFKDEKTSSARISTVPATTPWSTKESFLSTFHPQSTKVEQSTVDISVKVQFRGSVMPSYRHEETITAKNEHELREKLAKTLENALLDKQIDEVTITTEICHGNKVHSTHVTKFDATTPNGLDEATLVTTAKDNDITKAVTPSATRSTTEVHDVTTTTVLENVFTTRSITSIASTQSFQKSTSIVKTGKCDVTYNSKCFRVIVYDKLNVTLNVAKSLCENKLANIYDLTHLNLLKDYLRPLIPDERSWFGVCTGMSYKNGQLYSANDQVMSLSNETWAASFPNSDVLRTTVSVRVYNDPGNNEGIFNYRPDWLNFGAICENDEYYL
uniref:uncharacterized protein LOC120339797 isoform X2 n=1 Tax=Styela clava TaxID=7725 RepID=UPI001939E3C0|nr:uncharacterized protein LOC120339797 isoform X2 [Styela clava]